MKDPQFVKDSRELLASIPDCSGDMARLCLRLSQALELLDNQLTEQEENVIKDLFMHVGNSPAALRAAQDNGLTMPEFDKTADSIFLKLGNGRVTLVTEEGGRA